MHESALRAAPPTDAEIERVQRRSVRVLVAAQAIGAVGVTIGVASSSLLARDISGSDTQAGFAQTAQVLGSAAAAFWLARLMAARGRRIGQVTGMLLGAAGALLSVVAGIVESMSLLMGASALLGAMTAANSASRYAATDLARADQRARALSMVVWATTVGAVAGPNLTGPAGGLARSLGLPELTGPFLIGAVAMIVAAGVVAVFLRPDPLLLAAERDRALHAEQAAITGGQTARGDTLRLILARPALAAAVVAMACAHAVMVAVMIMTPLHMEHGGASLNVIGVVISGHVLGMYFFSPLVGLAADRWGRPNVLLAGAAVLLVALVTCAQAPQGSSWQISLGLFLLGVGWSLATVAASTTVADLSPLHARTQIQGLADLTMWITAAVGGALAGVIVGAWGYSTLASFSAVLLLGVFGGGIVGRRHGSTP